MTFYYLVCNTCGLKSKILNFYDDDPSSSFEIEDEGGRYLSDILTEHLVYKCNGSFNLVPENLIVPPGLPEAQVHPRVGCYIKDAIFAYSRINRCTFLEAWNHIKDAYDAATWG